MVEQGTKATDTQQLSQSREAVHERFSQDTLKENPGLAVSVFSNRRLTGCRISIRIGKLE